MKKIFIVATACIFSLFALCGCNDNADELKIAFPGDFIVDIEPGDKTVIGYVSELLTLEQLVDFHENGEKYPEGFVFGQLNGYGRVLDSAESEAQAHETVNNVFTNSQYTVTENQLTVETDLFYGLYAKWEHNTESYCYDEYVVCFKKNAYDAESKKFGTTNSDEIKGILDYLYYSNTYQIHGSKVYSSEISVKEGYYEYTNYCLQVCYGDWGLRDSLTFIKNVHQIAADTGETIKISSTTIGAAFVDGAGSSWGGIR